MAGSAFACLDYRMAHCDPMAAQGGLSRQTCKLGNYFVASGKNALFTDDKLSPDPWVNFLRNCASH